MGLASQWLLCAGLSYLGKTERLSGAAKNLQDNMTPDAIFILEISEILQKCRFKVKIPLELRPKRVQVKRSSVQVGGFAKTSQYILQSLANVFKLPTECHNVNRPHFRIPCLFILMLSLPSTDQQ